MDTLNQIGKLLGRDESATRDAIHIAVLPAIAAQDLAPGDHIRLDNGRAWQQGMRGAVGIVDPFLKTGPTKGARFWVFVYPGTITSLHHIWTHPEIEQSEDSVSWLKDFANRNYIGYQDLLDSTADGNVCFGSTSGPDEVGYEGGSDRAREFWEHYEKVMGPVTNEHKRATSFRCAC